MMYIPGPEFAHKNPLQISPRFVSVHAKITSAVSDGWDSVPQTGEMPYVTGGCQGSCRVSDAFSQAAFLPFIDSSVSCL
jgi:hypothetical protein